MNSGTGGRTGDADGGKCADNGCEGWGCENCRPSKRTEESGAFYGVAVGPDAEIPGGASGGAGPSRIRVFVRVSLKWLAVTTAGKLLDLAERFMQLYQWLVRVLG